MHRMSSRDAAYLLLGDGVRSSTVVSAWIFALDDAGPDGLADEVILSRMRTLVDLDDHFRCRAQFVPLSLGLPLWVLDEDFAVERHHVRHAEEMSWEQARRTLSAVGDEQLPRDRPLWREHLLPRVRGAPGVDGDAAIVAIHWHHAAFDGTRFNHLVRYALLDDPNVPEPQTWSTGTERVGALSLAVRDLLASPITWWRFVAGTRRAAIRKNRSSTGGSTVPLPRTRFSGTARAPRVCTYAVVSMADVDTVRRHVPGATVNDVALSVIGGALRDHLESLGEPAASSLHALVPISTRAPASAVGDANQFRAAVVDLHTDIREPLRRLAAVNASARAAKTSVREHHTSATPVEIPGPLLRLLGAITRSARLNGRTVTANVAVSNVGGTRGAENATGVSLRAVLTMQPLESGCLLAQAIRSVGDTLTITVTADAHVMSDPGPYMDRVARSLHDHLTAVRARTDG